MKQVISAQSATVSNFLLAVKLMVPKARNFIIFYGWPTPKNFSGQARSTNLPSELLGVPHQSLDPLFYTTKNPSIYNVLCLSCPIIAVGSTEMAIILQRLFDGTMETYSTIVVFQKRYIDSGRLRWSRGSVLAFSTQVRGFKPGRSQRIFRAKKSSARLPSERT